MSIKLANVSRTVNLRTSNPTHAFTLLDCFSVLESAVPLFSVLCHVLSPPYSRACIYCICLYDVCFFDCTFTGVVFVAGVSSSRWILGCPAWMLALIAIWSSCSLIIVIVYLSGLAFSFKLIEEDLQFHMFTFIAWDVGEHLYWM